MALRAAVLLSLCAVGAAQCPNGGVSNNGRCWYLSEAGASCGTTCSTNGLGFSMATSDEADPMTPKLLGRAPATKQFSWGRFECYVPRDDRYHTARPTALSDTGDKGEPQDWAIELCRLACPCAMPAGGAAAPGVDLVQSGVFPECVTENVVLRHAGAHAIFVDLSSYGSVGCWQNDCKNTDKFNSEDRALCARVCSEVEECTHWAHGEQEGTKKCFFRKSDGGREKADGWHAASKACAPAPLPSGFIAKMASQLLQKCDAGKSDACPDMARAISTWKFAIKHLSKAAQGQLDANMMQYINQITGDTDAFAAQMSEENFPVVVGNNRQVFMALDSWLSSLPTIAADPNDMSLPNPLRGQLCGATSCFDIVV